MLDKEKIDAIKKLTGYNIRELAEFLEIPKQTIYDIYNKNCSITKRLAKIIKEKLPQINHAWLLGASDEMYDENQEKPENQEKSEKNEASQQETATMLSLIEKLVDSLQKNADANLLNAKANEENSRSMTKLVEMLLKQNNN